jgi:hypothetical protein
MTNRWNLLKATLVFAFACASCGASRADEGAKIVTEARKQFGVTVSYDPAYTAMDYPGGEYSRENDCLKIHGISTSMDCCVEKLFHQRLAGGGCGHGWLSFEEAESGEETVGGDEGEAFPGFIVEEAVPLPLREVQLD